MLSAKLMFICVGLLGAAVSEAADSEAIISRVRTCQNNLQRGVMFTGDEIGKTASDYPDGCCIICARTNGCTAFTWTDDHHGMCSLKKFKRKAFPAQGSVSGSI
ncbi:Tartrate-resistant acid phosphatase type 5 [Phytophthora cinnamomi]|uniref:Tartrate-resistant acid phosphatase type 5 n=1 Tax=Phytophthora cinnamomi TaxID=4785 RepID=UPI00355A69D4|nr:Tartrate-resistant acid phosphatase type 5 [Phytophthora cinnamomi]